jgi:2-oxoglutarate dehydrogenase E2 component (dihydrolipoamide succinyltransferase)
MAKVDLIMPKMGESIIEATILNWVKNVGDSVDVDETILEIATDKVDSEIPSPVAGVIDQILFNVNDVVEVGKVIAIITTEGEGPSQDIPKENTAVKETVETIEVVEEPIAPPTPQPSVAKVTVPASNVSNRFYSPLVRNIAQKEQISYEVLETIPGTGINGRLTKKDLMNFIAKGKPVPSANGNAIESKPAQAEISQPVQSIAKSQNKPSSPKQTDQMSASVNGNIEIIQMDRMRKLIANHMVMSKQTSPHVTSFVEIDVTNLVNWRNSIKKQFLENHGEKITFTPLFIQAVAKAIVDYPMVNVSVDGDNILVKKDINIGMAAALPSGNLIVPVIRNANHLNLLGITKKVNDLANRARANKLKPEEIQGGTFTMTNVGTFGNSMGTPIINQPQVAILATGSIKKKPAVLETKEGDVIAIRQMMFLSLSYDHRVVDGFLGGSFLRRVGDYLEQFDTNQMV